MVTVQYDRENASYHITNKKGLCDVVSSSELESYLRAKKMSLLTFMAGFHQNCWPGTCPSCM